MFKWKWFKNLLPVNKIRLHFNDESAPLKIAMTRDNIACFRVWNWCGPTWRPGPRARPNFLWAFRSAFPQLAQSPALKDYNLSLTCRIEVHNISVTGQLFSAEYYTRAVPRLSQSRPAYLSSVFFMKTSAHCVLTDTDILTGTMSEESHS